MSLPKINIAIFASGNGTNAEAITRYFTNNSEVSVSIILSNNPNAYVLQRAKKFGIPTFVFSRQQLYNEKTVLLKLINGSIDFIVLAGFMWLIPDNILKSFKNKIINIHPALLPNYGGKGMYGHHVHEAVSKAGDTETGITIHFVNQEYDRGEIIFQIKCKIEPHENPGKIAKKVHLLEHEYYPKAIEQSLNI